ncbi:MAG: hypothetical protein ACJ786_16355 [Catenulispora sp.]
MTQNLSARRGALIAGISALVLLALIAAFDNQGTRSWRIGRMGRNGDTLHSWTSAPVTALSALDWRATPATDEPARHFAGVLAAAALTAVLTFLLVLLVCRGVAATRGRWALFAGTWFATALAAGLALIAGTAIAGTSTGAEVTDASGGAQFSRGDLYYGLLTLGLFFGLFAGWLVGLVAVLVYGVTNDSDGTEITREYPPSDYDYGAANPAAGPDYSVSPSSPYSPDPGYGGYQPPSAPTRIMPTPPQENDPHSGGNRSY